MIPCHALGEGDLVKQHLRPLIQLTSDAKLKSIMIVFDCKEDSEIIIRCK